MRKRRPGRGGPAGRPLLAALRLLVALAVSAALLGIVEVPDRILERAQLYLDPGRGLPIQEELAGEVAWRADWPGTGDTDVQLLGSWLDTDVLVWGGYHQLTGYDAGSGEVLWELAAPEGSRFCGMSPDADGGAGLVMAHRAVEVDGAEFDSCDQVTRVEAASGRQLWSAEIDRDEAYKDSARPRVADGAVLVPGIGRLYALDLGDGAELWRTEEWMGEEEDLDACEVDALPRGTDVVVYGTCAYPEDRSDYFLAVLDAAGGEPDWLRVLPYRHWGDDAAFPDWYLASAEPITLLSSFAGRRKGGLVYDENGWLSAVVPAAGENGFYDFAQRFFAGAVAEPVPIPGRVGSRALVEDGVVYAATDLDDFEATERFGVAAVELATGEALWAQRFPARQVVPMAVDGGRLIGLGHAYDYAEEAVTYEVVAFDLDGGGDGALLGPGVALAGADTDGPATVAHWQDGQMLLLPSGEGGTRPGGGAVTALE